MTPFGQEIEAAWQNVWSLAEKEREMEEAADNLVLVINKYLSPTDVTETSTWTIAQFFLIWSWMASAAAEAPTPDLGTAITALNAAADAVATAGGHVDGDMLNNIKKIFLYDISLQQTAFLLELIKQALTGGGGQGPIKEKLIEVATRVDGPFSWDKFLKMKDFFLYDGEGDDWTGLRLAFETEFAAKLSPLLAGPAIGGYKRHTRKRRRRKGRRTRRKHKKKSKHSRRRLRRRKRNTRRD